MKRDEMIMKVLEMLLGNNSPSEARTETAKPLIGNYVIVRCKDAGVHAGILENYEGREVHLKESRRLWYFVCKSGHSLSGVALHGVKSESKIAGQIDNTIVLTEACEILSTTEVAERSIRNATEHNAS